MPDTVQVWTRAGSSRRCGCDGTCREHAKPLWHTQDAGANVAPCSCQVAGQCASVL